MKFKALVSAVALAAAGVAHADIGNSVSSGTVELFATVFNANASITIDLGQDADSLLTNLASPVSFNLAADANWATFLSKAGAAPLTWSVQSVDQDTNTIWSTARIGQEATVGTTTATARANVSLNQAVAGMVNWQGNVNVDGDPTINVSTVGLAGTPAYWNRDSSLAYFSGLLNTSNTVGSAPVSLFNFTDNVLNPTSGAAKYDWSKSSNSAALNSSYVLTFQGAAVTPSVPEPESFGLALVALAAIGFVARRRSI